MRFLFLLILLISSAWCMDDGGEVPLAAPRHIADRKFPRGSLKPPFNLTWDASKLTDIGISVDSDLKRTLIECYVRRRWSVRPPRPEILTTVRQSAFKKTKREEVQSAQDSEEKTDSECTSTSAEGSLIMPAPDHEAIKTGMSFLLPSLKEKSYASRVELAFCLKAICDEDKANHPEERGVCLRLSKTFDKLASQLSKRQAEGQQVYLRNVARLYLQQQIRKSKEYPSEQEHQGRLTAIVDGHIKRLAADLVFSNKETYLTALVGENL
ncbi:MAG: hypothetical protein K2Q34_03680 [Alphaproteobacteria bacterium]|nr:hypothetical protein [Alphaproteobacteria bacterium]